MQLLLHQCVESKKVYKYKKKNLFYVTLFIIFIIISNKLAIFIYQPTSMCEMEKNTLPYSLIHSRGDFFSNTFDISFLFDKKCEDIRFFPYGKYALNDKSKNNFEAEIDKQHKIFKKLKNVEFYGLLEKVGEKKYNIYIWKYNFEENS